MNVGISSDRYNSTHVSNEITFTNLIAVANNPILFGALDPETQKKLVDIICSYTKGCITSISALNIVNRRK